MVSRVSIIPYREVSMKKNSARMNAWWFCSPTQLLILQKGKKKKITLRGKKKKAGFSFLLPPPTIREPDF